jgi:hypothetical protein
MREHKAIGRSDFEKILSLAVPDDSAEKTWPEVANALQHEHFDMHTIQRFRKAWREVEVYRTDFTNTAFWEVVDAARAIVAGVDSLKAVVSDGVADLQKANSVANLFTQEVLGATLLMVLYDVI